MVESQFNLAAMSRHGRQKAGGERPAAVESLERRVLLAGTVQTNTHYFTNPVINSDFPDPGAMDVNGTYYAFATNSHGVNVQAAKSNDLVHWATLPDALPNVPAWAQPGRTWGPDASPAADGVHYDLYYTAWARDTGRQEIGVATSASPAGPYTPVGAAPLVAQADLGGAIDPSPFTDTDGTRYLVWKSDGNAIGKDTWIYVQRLSSDGLTLLGSPTQLIREDQSWEGNVIEGPTLWKHDGKYFLFYCGNSFDSAAYAVGYAVADSPTGTYVKPAAPLARSENGVVGPGGPKIVVGPDGNTWMLYHSWENNFSYRSMSIDRLDWNGDVPVLRGPSRTTQPAPVPRAPLLTAARSDATGSYASGTLFGPANTALQVRFFDAVTGGANPTLVGSTTVTTDAMGGARFVDVSLSASAVGSLLTADVVDAAGDAGAASAALPVRLSGDVNGDSVVDFTDLVILARSYGQAGGLSNGDINGNGIVDFKDLVLLARNYGRSASTLGLAALASRGRT